MEMKKLLTFGKAMVVRLLFFTYCFISIWRVVATYENSNFWWMLLLLVAIVVETIITFYRRGGKEWKWFSPAIFFYLGSAVPCIWLIELHLLQLRHQESEIIANLTNVNSSNSLFGFTFDVELDEFGWALALEQSLFCILIMSRWALPRGDVSRNQLSQLLLVHVGMAADIMELFEVFEERKIVEAQYLVYPLLTLWTVSLLQYCLVITSTSARKDRFGGMEDGENEAVDAKEAKCTCHIGDWNADVVGIMTTILMQDLPFFIFRVYLLGAHQMLSHMMVFFTCKNALVIFLQVYRLIVIYLDHKKSEDEPQVISNIGASELDIRPGKNRVVPTPQKIDETLNENGNTLLSVEESDKGNNLRRSKNAFDGYGSTEDRASETE